MFARERLAAEEQISQAEGQSQTQAGPQAGCVADGSLGHGLRS